MICPVIKYNGYTFPNVYGPYTFSYTPTDFIFSCNFLIQKATSGSVITEEEQMLAAVKEVKKALSISFNGSSAQNLQHDTTGFNARVTVSKIKDVGLSTATSRAYSLSCTVELPYTQDAGKIQANMVIKYDSTRRATAIFTMLYSADATSTSKASTVYAADTWDATMLGTFLTDRVMEKVSEDISQDQNAKRCTVTKVYREVIYPESTISSANLDLVNAEYTYSYTYIPVKGVFIACSNNDVPKSILVLTLNFSGMVDKDRVSSTGLATLYTTHIRQTMISKATEILEVSNYQDYINPSFFIMSEKTNINPSDSMIYASIELGCRTSENVHITKVSETMTTMLDNGLNYVKLWDGQEGTYYMYSLGATRLLIRNVLISQVEEVPKLPPMTEKWGIGDKTGDWVLLKSNEIYSAESKGAKDSFTYEYKIYTKAYTETYLYINKANSISALIGKASNSSTGNNSGSGGIF